jgi:preprotein translocase subunit SecY
MFSVPELKKRILFTLSMLAVYRIGVFVTLPGVNRFKMAEFFQGAEA